MAQAETKPATATAKEEPARTSLAERGTRPGEVTVQFRKWHAHGMTAYQKGTFAGFPIRVAEQLEAEGAVTIDPSFRRETVNRMVRK